MTPELHLKAQDYQRLPWKTGTGATDEIWIWPPQASRDAFSIRISRAPITTTGAFSSFPGADRVITLIEGAGLSLAFAGTTEKLAPLEPFRFDTGLAPIGEPLGGPVRVFNVMADRADWRIASAAALQGGAEFAGAPAVIFALEPQRITTATGSFDLGAQDTLVTPAQGRTGGRALVITLAANSGGQG